MRNPRVFCPMNGRADHEQDREDKGVDEQRVVEHMDEIVEADPFWMGGAHSG